MGHVVFFCLLAAVSDFILVGLPWFSASEFFCISRERTERPEDWVPVEATSCKYEGNAYNVYSEINFGEDETRDIVDIFSIHSTSETGMFLTCLNVIKYSN